MSSYRLLKHRQYDRSADRLPSAIRHKAIWSQVLLGTRGRTPNVKSTTGLNARWRRTPVQGYHYYLWWIPFSESELAVTEPAFAQEAGRTILVHSIRHHDETDDPIDLHSLDEFEEVHLENLDPRFDEQRTVGERLLRDTVSLATIKGLPGSGKTVSLFYLVRDLAGHVGMQNILYVTYTSRLKRAASEFLSAQGAQMDQHVRVYTLTETIGQLLGVPFAHLDPFGDLPDFMRFLDKQPASMLGEWRRYPETLYTELRAYLFGRKLPAGFALPDGIGARSFFPSTGLDNDALARAYADLRGVDRTLADLAVRLADRLQHERFFADQRLAARALQQLQTGKLPAWLRNLDALIVDEVQDLTLLQTLLLGDMARTRVQRRPDAPLVVAVAGDESQIVQPSGFDWGETKDLLRDLLGSDPVEFEFRHQRRAPRNLARLIDNAWGFYSHLPKPLRPSANRQSFLDAADIELSSPQSHSTAEDENGRILLCPLPDELQGNDAAAAAHWRALVELLNELPGRVLVDLTEKLLPVIGAGNEQAGEVVFLPREIKGLERNTVLVYGLDEVYRAALRGAERGDSFLARIEARRVFDEMRVALSRSTSKLVLLEPAHAQVLDELGMAQLEGHFTLNWDGLTDSLKSEEMAEIEAVEGYLDEADDLLERGRWEQARRRNRRGYEFAVQIGDGALQREADEQFIRIYLGEAGEQLGRDNLREAYVLNRTAHDLADQHGDPALLDEVDEQLDAIRGEVERKVDALVATAHDAAGSQDLALAYSIARTATNLLSIMHDAGLQAKLDEATVTFGWQWAIELVQEQKVKPAGGETLADLFKNLSEAMQRQKDMVGAQVTAVLADRYRLLPDHGPLTPQQLAQLIRYIDNYLEILAPLSLDPSAFVFVEIWLEEAFRQLRDDGEQFYEWGMMAQTFNAQSDYPPLDERLWDLENRMELRFGPQWRTTVQEDALVKFAAFSAAYNGDAATSSLLWEKLGQLELAVVQAREAGELERAYNLLRRAGKQAPDALSSAVKLMHQADQMAAKAPHLSRAERSTLAARLEALSTHLLAQPDLDGAAAQGTADADAGARDSAVNSAKNSAGAGSSAADSSGVTS